MPPVHVITRYDSIDSAISPLDPLEDVTSWIAGLNSLGYTADILSKVHGIPSGQPVKRASQVVGAFARSAIGLLEQAYSGPDELSFLPLYYAILNLSKIAIVASGDSAALAANRWHGATHNPLGKVSQDLLNEQIVIKARGVLPLFYQAITGSQPPKRDKTICMKDVYPYMRNVGYEYAHAYGETSALQFVALTVTGDPTSGFRVLARTAKVARPESGNLRYLKVITGFRTTSTPDEFQSKTIAAQDLDTAKQRLLPTVRRFLLYETAINAAGQPSGAVSPLSNRQFFLPEEIPIWLAFFHLSNIVRYNPEFIDRLRDSKAWPILLGMRKHCILRFLLLTWSFIHKREFVIQSK